MPIFSPDIFDSIGDAIVTGGGTGVSTFVALNDTPASYSGEGLQNVRVNSGETALEFSNNVFYRYGWGNLSTARILIDVGGVVTGYYFPTNVFIVPEKCQVVSVQFSTQNAGGNTVLQILNPLKSEFTQDSSGATPLESVTVVSTVGGVLYTANFGASSTFDKGDFFALAFDPTTAPAFCVFTITFKLVV